MGAGGEGSGAGEKEEEMGGKGEKEGCRVFKYQWSSLWTTAFGLFQ